MDSSHSPTSDSDPSRTPLIFVTEAHAPDETALDASVKSFLSSFSFSLFIPNDKIIRRMTDTCTLLLVGRTVTFKEQTKIQ